MSERIRLKIGRASYIQRLGEKDYLKTRSRIESLPLRKLVKLSQMVERNWRLVQEGNDLFLILEAVPWDNDIKSSRKA